MDPSDISCSRSVGVLLTPRFRDRCPACDSKRTRMRSPVPTPMLHLQAELPKNLPRTAAVNLHNNQHNKLTRSPDVKQRSGTAAKAKTSIHEDPLLFAAAAVKVTPKLHDVSSKLIPNSSKNPSKQQPGDQSAVRWLELLLLPQEKSIADLENAAVKIWNAMKTHENPNLPGSPKSPNSASSSNSGSIDQLVEKFIQIMMRNEKLKDSIQFLLDSFRTAAYSTPIAIPHLLASAAERMSTAMLRFKAKVLLMLTSRDWERLVLRQTTSPISFNSADVETLRRLVKQLQGKFMGAVERHCYGGSDDVFL